MTSAERGRSRPMRSNDWRSFLDSEQSFDLNFSKLGLRSTLQRFQTPVHFGGAKPQSQRGLRNLW